MQYHETISLYNSAIHNSEYVVPAVFCIGSIFVAGAATYTIRKVASKVKSKGLEKKIIEDEEG